jgi:error-prone DNA polymerase
MVARHRQAVVAARLVLAEGRVERTEAEVPILHLIVQLLTDRSDLLDGLHALDAPAVARGIARADEVKRPNLRGDPRGAKSAALCHPPEPGLARPPAEPGLARMGRSRDFH